ncbi:hypothetical protein J6P92_04750 [bacterium]|nr:hypothetical protein [bacterium]
MSVNAINAADQQPQRKSSPIVPALVSGAVLGAAGYGGGYWLGGSRPDLDKVFAMPEDKFTESTKEGLNSATDAQKTDLETIKGARKEYADAGAEKLTAMKAKGKEIAKNFEKVSVDAKLFDDPEKGLAARENAFNSIGAIEIKKDADGNPVKKTFAELKKAVTEANNKLKAAKTDADKTTAKNELADARKDMKAFLTHDDVKDKLKNRNEARKAVRDARKTANDSEVARLKGEFTNLKTEYTDAKSTKLNALKNDKTITDAFESVKKLFAKEGKGKTAWIAAGIAAVVGLIGGFILGGSKEA